MVQTLTPKPHKQIPCMAAGDPWWVPKYSYGVWQHSPYQGDPFLEGQLKLDRRIVGRGGLTWIHLVSLGLTCIHLDSFGLTWTHLDSLGITWTHVGSLVLTWPHLDSLGLTWIH